MKKILITLVFLSGIFSAAFAQTKNTAEFGVNAGINGSTVVYSGSNESSDYTGGVNLGVSGEYYFSDRWSIKARLSYDQKGWGNGVLTTDNGSRIYGVNFHLNYLTIPVMASWHFGRTRNWYLHFGPYAGILLNSRESSNSGLNIQDAFNTSDFGVDVGIGVKIPVSDKMKFFIEYDGQSGLSNLFKYSDGDNVQNMRSGLNIGLSFPIR